MNVDRPIVMKPTTQLPADENERIRMLLAEGADPRGIRVGVPKKSRSDRFRSKWESLFAGELEDRKRAGEILDWRYEELRLRIGDGAYYKPDFFTIGIGGELTIYEVKGYMREAANIRIKAAKDRYPWWTFVIVRREGAGWKEMVF